MLYLHVFVLILLINVSEVQNNQIIAGGVPMWGTPWGGPPRTPKTPPGVLRCQRVLEKIAKILKKIY